jgi:hypothetical protein
MAKELDLSRSALLHLTGFAGAPCPVIGAPYHLVLISAVELPIIVHVGVIPKKVDGLTRRIY